MNSIITPHGVSRQKLILNMLTLSSKRNKVKVEYVAFITPTGKLYVEHVDEVPFIYCIPIAIGCKNELEDLFTTAGYEYNEQEKYWQYGDVLDNTGRRRSQNEMLYLAQHEANKWETILDSWKKKHCVSVLQVYKQKKIYIPGGTL